LLATRGKDTARLFACLPGDLAQYLRPPLVGAGLVVVAAGVVVAVLLVTPTLYPAPARHIAGGVEEIATGRTGHGHNWIGAEKPELVITEYSDYECPFCRKAHEVVRKLVRERKDWLRLVHVHVPLDHSCNPMLKKPFHRHACDCARAAICADRQDYFWEMNDALFIRRGGLDAGGLTVLAGRLGLDEGAFRTCMKDLETEKVLQHDIQECREVAKECRKMGRGFGTPTFTVEGQVVVGAKKRAFWVRLTDRLRRERRERESAQTPAPEATGEPEQPGQQPDG
jgi:predicted DsbA family dithiol-disulfide isomerase